VFSVYLDRLGGLEPFFLNYLWTGERYGTPKDLLLTASKHLQQ
jgi:hypothetical protein